MWSCLYMFVRMTTDDQLVTGFCCTVLVLSNMLHTSFMGCCRVAQQIVLCNNLRDVQLIAEQLVQQKFATSWVNHLSSALLLSCRFASLCLCFYLLFTLHIFNMWHIVCNIKNSGQLLVLVVIIYEIFMAHSVEVPVLIVQVWEGWGVFSAGTTKDGLCQCTFRHGWEMGTTAEQPRTCLPKTSVRKTLSWRELCGKHWQFGEFRDGPWIDSEWRKNENVNDLLFWSFVMCILLQP